MSQPVVSIVVPAYNEANHIAECLESILAQSYQNWECIVANNCSTDATAEIARQYASKDARIRVYDNEEFLRAVPNFNQALRRLPSSAKYCKIVFADDWIFPECIEEMVDVAEEYPSIGIVGAYGLQGRQVMWAGLPYPSRLISGREVCRKLFLEDLYVFGTATSLLFRADLIRASHAFYNETNLHSDSEACCAALKTSDFGFVHQVLTVTRVREGSLFAFSTEMNTFIAGRLHDLVTYGRDYLTAEEYKFCLDLKLSEYYDFLSRNLTHRRGDKFWNYHKGKLAEAGVGLSRTRLYRTFAGKLFDALLNPKSTLERLLKKPAAHDPEFLPGFHESPQAR
ncbi:glycosyltransferase family 2 protein [Acidobacterium sp. S8]|uniref:glycosyltransferase family 2 protein n=1 Tax=Acidobacterium sp. S8 TaxID=1641854 RepID=UPI00131AA154|nr:glycosyltransferase family 2 protein [Acidobacterium sp. S8]